MPGCVSGWETLRARFGTKPLAELLAAGDRRGRRGLPRAGSHRRLLARRARRRCRPRPDAAATFLIDGERAPRVGEIMKLPQTGRDAAADRRRQGRDAFYKGDIAKEIVAFSEKHGGYFSLRRLRRSHRRMGRAGLDELSRLRRVGAAAQRPGHRRPANAQRARAVRPQVAGAQLGRASAPVRRGQEAGLRRPGASSMPIRPSASCRSSELISKEYGQTAGGTHRHADKAAADVPPGRSEAGPRRHDLSARSSIRTATAAR